MLLLTLAVGALMPTFAQSTPNVIGKWDYIGDPDQHNVSIWRINFLNPGSTTDGDDSSYTSYGSRYNGFQNTTFGYHGALLHNKDTNIDWIYLSGENKRPDLGTHYGTYFLWDVTQQGNMSKFMGQASFLKDPDTSFNYTQGVDVDPAKIVNSTLHCPGQVFLPDGRLFLGGGERTFPAPQQSPPIVYPDDLTVGSRLAWIFSPPGTYNQVQYPFGYWGPDPNNNNYLLMGFLPKSNQAALTDGSCQDRYYPTCCALPDGRVLILGGLRHQSAPPGHGYTQPYYTTNYQIFDSTITDPNVSPFEPHDISSDTYKTSLGDQYPRIHLVSVWDTTVMPNKVVSNVMYVGTNEYVLKLDLNVSTPNDGWSALNTLFDDGVLHPKDFKRTEGCTVLLPNSHHNPSGPSEQVLSRVMTICGKGDGTAPALRTSAIIDFAANKRYWHDQHYSSPYNFVVPDISSDPNDGRRWFNTVILPNGKLFVIGGANDAGLTDGTDPVLSTFLYDPEGGTGSQLGAWTPMASASLQYSATDGPVRGDILLEPRYYNGNTYINSHGIRHNLPDGVRMHHSVALLLPDGKVFTAGTTNPNENKVPALYTPSYLLDVNGRIVTRPTLVLTPGVTWHYSTPVIHAASYSIPSGHAIDSVVLMRPSAVTHAVNMEQRLIRCHFDTSGGTLNITPPYDPGIAPPGWYMLFLVDDSGCYSTAVWCQLLP